MHPRLTTIAARAGFILCVALTAFFALSPPSVHAHVLPWDKADHFIAFFAITGAALVAFPRLHPVWIALVVSVLGGGIELAQALPFIGRDSNFGDWISNEVGIGAALGVLAAAELRRRLRAD